MAKKTIFDHRDLNVRIDCRATPMCHARLNFAMYPAASPCPGAIRESHAEKRPFLKPILVLATTSSS